MTVHPFIVHYAVAFLSVLPLVWLALCVRQRQGLRWVFWSMAIAGMLAAMGAVITGELAQTDVEKLEPLKSEQVAYHETLAYWTVIAYAAAILWILARHRKMDRKEQWLLAVVLFGCAVLLLFAAAAGGAIFHPG